jgi:hypothetical protein
LPLLLIAALAGILLSGAGILMMSGSLPYAIRPSNLAAGIVSGWIAALWTVFSRTRRDGEEHWLDGFAGYYLSLIAWWMTWVVGERVSLCIAAGGWTDFDLADHLVLGVWVIALGTVPVGLLLIPASFIARRLFWAVHLRSRTP